MNQKILIGVFFLLACVQFSQEQVAKDLVTSLPGINVTLPTIYSGYLNFTSLVSGTTRHVHYVLVERLTGYVTTSPLIVWMNGGPGCSGMEGLFSEIGPFLIPDESWTINNTQNPATWASAASLLFLDTPVGTGFSYDNSDPKPIYNDFNLAQDNQLAVQTFFQLYPDFKTSDLYIAGQGYSGKQVPMLGYWLSKNVSSVNLKGLILGNGFTDDLTLAYSSLSFAADHALFSTDLQNLTYQSCQQNYFAPSCAFTFQEWISNSEYLNPFNIYGKCYNASAWVKSTSEEFTADFEKYKKSSSGFTRAPWSAKNKVKMEERLASGYSDWTAQADDPPCVWDAGLYNYMNNVSVMIDLHVNTQIEFVMCNRTITNSFDFGKLTQSYSMMADLKSKGKKILYYYGDADSVVPYKDFYAWYPKVNASAPSKDWRPWYPSNSKNALVNVGGFVTEWDNLWMVTVRNAGQMAPQDKPLEMLYVVSQFLKGKEL